MPAALVGKYCMQDVRQTFEIFEKQIPKIESENLQKVYDLERSLIPCLLKMKRTGVRIDLKKLKKLKTFSEEKENDLKKELKEKYNIVTNENGTITNAYIKEAFDRLGYPYIMSDKDNACFDKKELLRNGKELGAKIVELRHCQHILKNYIQGLEPFIIGDRVHPEFNSLRNDEHGTRMGRFSGSRPNLQNQPKPDEDETEDSDEIETALLIRSLYLPEENHIWAKLDYCKMEMMTALHFAGGEGSGEMRDLFTAHPELDPYKIIASVFYGTPYKDITKKQRGIFKTQTLASMYGMGPDLLGRNMETISHNKIEGLSKRFWAEVFSLPKKMKWEDRLLKAQDCIDIDEWPYFEQYFDSWKSLNKINKKFPWMKKTSAYFQEKANENGYVTTILGRRRRFDLTKTGDDGKPSTTYKAFHSRNSGSCADIMKSAMLKAHQDGIFDIIPLGITVHDELDNSVPDTKAGRDALEELKNIMETVIKLRVPLRVEIKTGENWGSVK